MADIYTASEDGNRKDTENLIKPFLCGYCKTDFEAFEKFYIHLESHDVHIGKCVHVCNSSLIKEDLYSSFMITCMCCLGKFGNLCQLHEHILKCSGEGSYLYLHNDKRKAAYPMGPLCDFVAARSECAEIEPVLPPLIETNGNARKDLNEIVKGLWLENGMNSSKLINGTKRTEGFKDVSMDTNDLKSYVENENVTRGRLTSNRSDLQQKRSRKNKCNETKVDNLVQTVVDNDGSDFKANKESDDNELKARCFLVKDVIACQGEETAMCKNFHEDTDEVDEVSLKWGNIR